MRLVRSMITLTHRHRVSTKRVWIFSGKPVSSRKTGTDNKMPVDINNLVFSKLSETTDVSMFRCSDSDDLQDFLRSYYPYLHKVIS